MPKHEITEAVEEYIELLKQDMRIHAQMERELMDHPLTCQQMEPLQQMVLARRKDFCSLIYRVMKIDKVFLGGGDWAKVHRDVRQMEALTRMRYDPLAVLISELRRAIREEASS